MARVQRGENVVLLPKISSKEILNKEIIYIKRPCPDYRPVGVDTLLVLSCNPSEHSVDYLFLSYSGETRCTDVDFMTP